MGRATVEREIARLDALSRTRALEPGETILLEKMIRTEKQYAAMRDANARARAARSGGEPEAAPLTDPDAHAVPAARVSAPKGRPVETPRHAGRRSRPQPQAGANP